MAFDSSEIPVKTGEDKIRKAVCGHRKKVSFPEQNGLLTGNREHFDTVFWHHRDHFKRLPSSIPGLWIGFAPSHISITGRKNRPLLGHIAV